MYYKCLKNINLDFFSVQERRHFPLWAKKQKEFLVCGQKCKQSELLTWQGGGCNSISTTIKRTAHRYTATCMCVRHGQKGPIQLSCKGGCLASAK